MDHPFDVRALRERIGWKQDRLAKYLGVDRSSISRMENGQPLSGPVSRLLSMLAAAADEGRADALCMEQTGLTPTVTADDLCPEAEATP